MKKSRRQKYICLYLLLFLFLSAVPTLNIQASNSSLDKDKEIVRVGWYPLNGFQDGSSEDTLNGYAYEFLNKISEYANFEYTYFFGSWNECYQAQLNGEIDLLCGVVKTDTRTQDVYFSDRRFGYKSFMLSTNSSDTRFSSPSLSTLSEMKIGAPYESYGTKELEEYRINENLNFSIVYFQSINDSIEALKTGDIDISLDNSLRNHIDESTLIKFPEQPIYITISKGNPELLKNLNLAMNEIYASSKNYDSLLNEKYFSNSYSKDLLFFSKEELSFIDSAGPIPVYYDSNWDPISCSANHGNFQGPIREIFDLISDSTGLTFVYKTAETFDLLQTKYQNDDLAILASMENDLLYAKKIDSILTLSYLSSERVLLSTKNDYQNISTIGVPFGYYLPYQLLNDTRFQIVRYPTLFDCIKATNTEEVDSCITSLCQANEFLSKPIYKNMHIIIPSQIRSNTSMAIKNDSPRELLSILNKAISNFSEEELNTIIFNSSTQPSNEKLTQNLYENPWILLSFLILFLVLLYFIFDRQQQKKYTLKLESANAKIKKANTAKSDFLGRMSHDMRTPMNAIINLSNFGLEESNTPTLQEYFQQINASSLYLLGLVNDILNMQKLEFNKIILTPEIVNLKTILETNKQILIEHAKNKNINFQTTFHVPKKYKYILIDVLRLNQIIINITNNAIKYTENNGLVKWNVTMIEKNKQPFISMFVEDNGVGMSIDFQTHQFERFSQEKNSQSSSESGSGLGLAICKNLVESMNGTIFCSSQLEVGTSFTINIPILIPAEKELNYYLSQTVIPYQTEHVLNNKHILICEDVEVNALILQKILKNYQIHSEIAKNGKIGLEMATKQSYDCILMDIRMPIMDGLTATKEIRKFDQKTPIIALSANTYDEDIKKSIDAGMNAHLSKPINKEELYNFLVKLIKTDA